MEISKLIIQESKGITNYSVKLRKFISLIELIVPFVLKLKRKGYEDPIPLPCKTKEEGMRRSNPLDYR